MLDKLDGEASNAIEEHLAFCGNCADELLHIMRMEAALDTEAEQQANGLGQQAMLQAPALSYWEPYGIGLESTAAETPKQTQLFSTSEGTVELTCDWGSPQGSDPAYIWVAWEAAISQDRILELRIVDPETGKLRYKTCLGSASAGEEIFSSHELSFDPSRERWAVAIAVTALLS
jgi:hypothetical protein